MDRLLPWLRRSGWAYLAAALALALVAWRLAPGPGDGGQPGVVAGATAPAAVVAPADPGAAPEALVHVAGEVRRPGVYPIGPGARVIEAVRRAGGPTRRADMSGLNLAATLVDGQQVRVPRRVAPGAATAAGAEPGAAAGPISLSSATAGDLDALDGIGPTLAARIVEWRDAHGGFAAVDQLLEVPGIGPGRLESLRPHVVP
ncbi:helix-hairpin-helix domain-containing protein [Miltoncostaea oceani]|uniref:helix-hairpin-helix domain-containing protein n=1 Tax=Miltoncostaea oceani TaxID=2843216 RepID=UPI001C3C4286|nr:ComEA family DNA-binding protein [Miltoncostaea oceani]